MDALLGLVELLLPLFIYWRVGIAGVVAFVTAVVLAAAIAPFNGLCGIAVVLVGLGAGMLWEMDAAKANVGASTNGSDD